MCFSNLFLDCHGHRLMSQVKKKKPWWAYSRPSMKSGTAQNTRRPISVVMSPRTTSRCGQRILKTLDSSTSAKTGSPTSPSVTSHVRVQRGSWFHGHTTMWALRTITNYWLQALGLLQRLDTSSWLIQSLANIMIFGNSTCAGMRWMQFNQLLELLGYLSHNSLCGQLPN